MHFPDIHANRGRIHIIAIQNHTFIGAEGFCSLFIAARSIDPLCVIGDFTVSTVFTAIIFQIVMRMIQNII
jgi:hypothetical protein